MSSVQVKNVDEETHELLRQRAASAGMTLGEYVLELIRKDLRKPSKAEWLARIRARPPANVSHEEVIRSIDEGRAERDRRLDQLVQERER
jgi:plasmid stability protein